MQQLVALCLEHKQRQSVTYPTLSYPDCLSVPFSIDYHTIVEQNSHNYVFKHNIGFFVDRNLSAEAGNTIPSPLPYSELNNFRLVGSIVMHFPSHFQHIIIVVVFKYSNLSDRKFNGRKSILMGIDKCWTYIFGGNPSDVIYHSHPINNCLFPRTVFPNTLVNWTLPLPGCFSLN